MYTHARTQLKEHWYVDVTKFSGNIYMYMETICSPAYNLGHRIEPTIDLLADRRFL